MNHLIKQSPDNEIIRILEIERRIKRLLHNSEKRGFSTAWGDAVLLADDNSFRCTLWDRNKLTMHFFMYVKDVGGKFTSYDYKKKDFIICEDSCPLEEHLFFLEEILDQIRPQITTVDCYLKIFIKKVNKLRTTN